MLFYCSLYRDSKTKVMDCYSKQFLLALSNFFKSLVPVGAERLSGKFRNFFLRWIKLLFVEISLYYFCFQRQLFVNK